MNEIEPSAKPPLHKQSCGHSGQKLHKSRYQSLSSCLALLDFTTLFHTLCSLLKVKWSKQIILDSFFANELSFFDKY